MKNPSAFGRRDFFLCYGNSTLLVEMTEKTRNFFKKSIFFFCFLWYDDKQDFYGTGTFCRRGGDDMKKHWKAVLLWAVLLLGTLSGCFFRSPEDLYQSPEPPADYQNLTQKIRDVKNGLAQEYGVAEVDDISVIAGDNTALIQLQDMDGDGQRETAVTFFRVPGAEKPLKIYFFTKTQEDVYNVSAMLEGDGSGIYQIDYVDLNGEGYKEVVVSWQMSTGAYLLGVYSLEEPMSRNCRQAELSNSAQNTIGLPDRQDLRGEEWMTTAYGDYVLTDLDQNNESELCVVRIDPKGANSAVEVYTWQNGTFGEKDSAPLSVGIRSMSASGVKQDYLAGEVLGRALYVSTELNDERHAVDVVAYQNGKLVNLSLDPTTHVSVETLSQYVDLEPTDVNGDGVLELPEPVSLPQSEDTTASDFWLIDWWQYQTNGKRTKACTTYHNVADGWYLLVPDDWKDQITLSRYDAVSGQRAVIFSHLKGDGTSEPFLVIYKFTSQTNRANTSNRFVLREEKDAVYAAAFYNSEWDCGMNETELRAAFRLIQNGWSDG